MQSLILTAGLDPSSAEKITNCFSPPRYKALHKLELDGFFQQICESRPAVVIFAVPGRTVEDGLPLIRKIRSWDEQLPIILISRISSEERAIEGFRAGINDYFKMPMCHNRLFSSISRLIEKRVSIAIDGGVFSHQPMVAESMVMQKIKAHLLRIASAHCTVLITGETGTGKELTAAMVHLSSPRSKGPFVCVNCAALPENLVESELFGHRKGSFTGAVKNQKGKFELATGGTLFLDEIGDMQPYSQAKILRTIEDKRVTPVGALKAAPVDMRIIAATNQDPEDLVEKGKFRKDLFYRLNVARIHLPPLRERKEDIPQLVGQRIEKLNNQYQRDIQGLTTEAMTMLYQYNWPGNIRELKNCIEHAFIKCRSKRIAFSDLPPIDSKKLHFCARSPANDRDKLLMTLAATKGNKSEAAKRLRWSRMRVYRTLQRYNQK